MHVLYLPADAPSSATSPLLSKRTYDALYTDKSCFKELKAGDTLYVERVSFMADSMREAVVLLRNLARSGVDVWCERTGRMFEAKTSPFRDLSEDIAQAVIEFRNTFTRIRQHRGLKAARREGLKGGRRKKALPANFDAVRDAYLSKKLRLVEAATECSMSVTTFWKRVNENASAGVCAE